MTRRRKYSDLSFNVDVDIPLWELLEALNDEDLLEEIKSRQLAVGQANAEPLADLSEALRSIWERLHANDADEALLIAERYLFPKFKSIEACETKLKELRPAATTGSVQ